MRLRTASFTGLMMAHTASAYVLIPLVWQNGISSLRACVAGPVTATQANGALVDWNATATTFGYVGDCGASTWQIKFNDYNDPFVSFDGYTTITHGALYTTRAQIYLNYGVWGSYAAGAKRSVANHELGHALTLNHSQYGYALMNPLTCFGTGTRWCWYGIEVAVGDDVQGINARYP